jgi:tetratricopeptide (TPR) repeat protein
MMCFAATLSPVIGFIMLYTFRYTFVADHYQYLACLGPLALIAAGIERGLQRLSPRARSLDLKPIACGVLLTTLAAMTWAQSKEYANSETLWSATLARNPASWMAHDNLGNAMRDRGSLGEAVAHYRKALGLNPDFPEGFNDLGVALIDGGRTDLGIAQYREALKLEPDFVKAHYNLGNALVKLGQMSEAISEYRKALLIQPRSIDARVNLGLALLQTGRTREAIEAWEQVLAIRPDFPLIENRLAWLLATVPDASLRNGARAVALAEKANRATGSQDPEILATLAAAYAEAGRFDKATATAQTALALAKSQGNDKFTAALEEELKLFDARKPMRTER